MEICNVQSENQSILQRIARGNQAAVRECLDKYGNLVWYLAKRYTHNAADAEDAGQEIFIDIWKNAGRFDPRKASEATFISLIARRRLIDRLRKQTSCPPLLDLNEISIGTPQDSEKQMQISLDAGRAAQIIGSLRPEQRTVIKLAIFGGLTHSEIVAETGMPLGTVKTHLRRGFEKLRRALGFKSENLSNFAAV